MNANDQSYLAREIQQTIVDEIADAFDDPLRDIGCTVIEMATAHIRREFLVDLKERALEDGFEFFSNYDAIPEPPSDEYTDSGTWFDRLIAEEGAS